MIGGIDYTKIGLKVGLEIHQQLSTSSKLFCDCSPELFREEPKITFLRRLRPTQSELGQIDPAAFFEFQKGVKVLYEANQTSSCLVEMDEEPPHAMNQDAVSTVLTAALMMKCNPVDEIHVMRKTVIDGSNTTGFQRTCVIALDGTINVDGKDIPILHASLEEDAARKTGVENGGKTVRYRIDRLGIPLVEVATGPVIKSPEEAQKVAEAIGRILRDTGRVIRGLGTIRQDLNVSISEGALIEIKGVQELELISRVVEYEVKRQLNLLLIGKELKKRGASTEELKEEFVDVTNIFEKTESKVIAKALTRKHKVLAVKLRNFEGFLKLELMPNFRLGTELADRARYWGRVGGVFHTDELPAYGVSAEEVEGVRRLLGASKCDAVVLVADSFENCTDALKAVIARAKEAISDIPSETRTANPDGTTRYMRPRPGAARMYPETDIPTVQIAETFIESTRKNLPEPDTTKLERLQGRYGLNSKLSRQVVDSEYSILFEDLVKTGGISPTTVAVFLTETLRALRRDGIQTEAVADDKIREIFDLVDLGEVTKEAAPDLFIWLSKNPERNAQEAANALGLKKLSEKELEAIVDRIIVENHESIEKLGNDALGKLMGVIMKEVRGKTDAIIVSRVLKEKLSASFVK